MRPARKRPLSDREVKALKASASVGGAPGLECVVSPRGTRSWRLLYRVAGDPTARRRSMGLGRYPAVSLADARDRANQALAQASDGVDPQTARVADNDVLFGDCFETYLDWCVTENAPGTIDDKRSLARVHALPRLGALPVRSISREDVIALLDDLSDRPARRRAAYSYVRHFFEWAVERRLAATNPCLGVRAPRLVASRDRILSDGEIRALWQAEGVYATIARLSLLTAQRRGSIAAMRWTDLDRERRMWTIPAAQMKSGKLHEAPLSSSARDEISDIPRMHGPFVFGVGSHGHKPYDGASNGMEGLRRQLTTEGGPPDWRLHDLRRTAVSLAQRGGASIEEIRALTQHKTPGVIGVYARHAYGAEKLKVVELIESAVRDILVKCDIDP